MICYNIQPDGRYSPKVALISKPLEDHYELICSSDEEQEIDILQELNRIMGHKYDTTTLKRLDWSPKTLNDITYWYNDTIVNNYMNILKIQNKDIHVMDSYFFTQLTKGYNRVERWTKINIFQKKFVIVPICSGALWTLIIVDMRARMINRFDSRYKPNKSQLQLIKDYLEQERKTKKTR